MRDKLERLDRLIDDAITISETILDWEVRYNLVFSANLARPIFDLSRELGLPCGYDSPGTSYQADVLAFIEFIREKQKVITIVLEAFHKKAIEGARGHQNFGKEL